MVPLYSSVDWKKVSKFLRVASQSRSSRPSNFFFCLFSSPPLHTQITTKSDREDQSTASKPKLLSLFILAPLHSTSLSLHSQLLTFPTMLRSSAAPTTPTKRPLTELLTTSKRTTVDVIAKKRKLSSTPPQSERSHGKENREIGERISESGTKVEHTEEPGERDTRVLSLNLVKLITIRNSFKSITFISDDTDKALQIE